MKADDFTAGGADREAFEQLHSIKTDSIPVVAKEAFYGLAGRIVRAIEPHSEADPTAILANVLVGAGNMVGRGPHAMVEESVHTCNEFAALVGVTAKGRKGQSWSTPRKIYSGVDAQGMRKRVKTGLSSGEGLIYNVRDERREMQPVKDHGRVIDHEEVVVDQGEVDKRLLIIEPELASVLRRMRGEGNSLSSVIREAWDSGNLSTLTKNSPLTATGAHVSIIGHITAEELATSLTETERANGFANRFLFFLVKRSKALPNPTPIPPDLFSGFTRELSMIRDHWAGEPKCLRRDGGAEELWAGVYPKLSEGEGGLLGAIIARAEAHVLRLSLVYAVLDVSSVVTVPHLKAALAVWDHAAASARRIFGGNRLGLTVADTILAALKARGPLTKTEIWLLFGRNKQAAEIDAVLAVLDKNGKVKRSARPPEGGVGRPAEVWEAV